MKIQSKFFINFLSKIKCDTLITEVILNFSDEGVKVLARDLSQVVMVNHLLDKTIFENYEAIGKIGITNLDSFIKKVERIGEHINIQKNDNMLKIFDDSQDRVIDLILPNTDYLKQDVSTEKVDKIEWDVTITVDTTDFKDIVDSDKEFDSDKTTVVIEKGILILNKGDDDKFTIKKSVQATNDVSCKYGVGFKEIISVLPDVAIFNMKTDFPIKITADIEGMKLMYVIAPVIENKD